MSETPTYATPEEAGAARELRLAEYAKRADGGCDLQTGEGVRDSRTGHNVLVHHKELHAHYDRAGTFRRVTAYRKKHPRTQWKQVWAEVENNYCDVSSFRAAMFGEASKRRRRR